MNQRFTFRAVAVGFAFSGLLAVAACGGDDDSSDTTTATEQTTETTAAEGTDTTEGTETTMAEGTETTAASSGDAEDCRAVAQEFTEALGGATNPTASPEQVAEAFAQIADSVPEDLKDDVELVGKGLETYAQVVADNGGDVTAAATDPDALAALQELATPEYAAATQAISTYFAETCTAG